MQVKGFLANQTSLSGCQPRTSCPRPLNERTLSPSLATTTAKASERVIADPPGLEREGEVRRLAQVVLAANTERVLPFFRFPFSVPSPGRSVTQARRLYESRLANSVKAIPDAEPRTQACDEAEHKVFPRPPYLRRARSQPTTSRLQKRTSLMEWVAKLGSSGACIAGRNTRCVPPATGQGCPICRVPRLLAWKPLES